MLDQNSFRQKVTGCWLGKAVGGTLGLPFEGTSELLDLTYYDPVPTEMLPNDDLDLQVVHAVLLEQMDRPVVDRLRLVKAWEHIGMSPDEYGICKRNLRLGLKPPLTGSYDNPFARGMGAAIRTELWACLAPGNPQLAARYAHEDACMDHAGEGIEAAQFLAALQSLAFIESRSQVLLDDACGRLPAGSELLAAIRDTRAWWAQLGDWRAVRQLLVERYRRGNFTDVVINLAYTVLGFLAGRDFGESICIAVNCGSDTDCTGATLGALLGIIDPTCMDDRWLAPIGRQLVLSPTIHDIEHSPTLDAFTDLVLHLRTRLAEEPPPTPAPQVPRLPFIRSRMRRADTAWAEEGPPRMSDALEVDLPGAWATLDAAILGPATHVRLCYEVTLQQEMSVHLMFCTPSPVRVWWDDRLVITSAGGNFVPALHRCEPADQIVLLHATTGRHVVTAELARAGEGALEWAFGLTTHPRSPVCRDWLTEPYSMSGCDHTVQAGCGL